MAELPDFGNPHIGIADDICGTAEAFALNFPC
jgi:hypothetical protein